MFNWSGKKNPEKTVVTTNRHSSYISGKDWMAHNSNRTKNYNSTGQWSNITTVAHTTTDSAITIDGGPNGIMKVDVPLIVNGRDIMKEIDEMRDALLLLKRDVDMESKYPKLKELKDAYERQLEKYKTFEAIKESK